MEILVLVGIVVAGLIYWAHVSQQRLEGKVRALIRQHADTLALKKLQGTRMDEYGNVVTTKWDNAKKYFIKHTLQPTVASSALQTVRLHAPAWIEEEVRRSFEDLQRRGVNRPITPLDYELLCVKALEEEGWSTVHAGNVGDQGVDIIASRGGIRVAIQVKCLTNAASNGAVQEVVAGRTHHNCDYAVVVARQRFTAAAEQLASSCGVLLLHDTQLKQLAERIGISNE